VGEIEALFNKQKEVSTEFARDMSRLLYVKSRMSPEVAAKVNLRLAKTVFSKWSIEILTILYSARAAGYGDLKRALRGVSSRVLSEKLKKLEQGGLVHRAIVEGRPPRTLYSLTEDGITVAKLGEPVFLFLGYKEGLYASPDVAVPRTRW
jgi:DNA-binding HxlR family transcriptional regulator